MLFGFSKSELTAKMALNTAQEIAQQPNVWKEIIMLIEKQIKKIEDFFNLAKNNDNVKFIFTGSGSSEFIGNVVSEELRLQANNFFSIPATSLVSSPETYIKKNDNVILVSFARSGNSPESVASVKLTKQLAKTCLQIIITCNKEGKLYQNYYNDPQALVILLPEETNDKSFAMTSSFSSMLLSALLIFSIYFNNFNDVKNQINDIIKRMPIWIENKFDLINNLVGNYQRAIILGSNTLLGYAQEGALKLLELTAGTVNGTFNSALGFRHGPKSMVDGSTLAIVLLSSNLYTRQYDIDIVKELFHDGKAEKIIVLDNVNDESILKYCHAYFALNEEKNIENNAILGLEYILILQIFALLTSLKLKISPDNPCPSGEVNRVVKGVTIYPYLKK